MAKKIIKTNPNLIELINKLYEQSRSEDAAIWKDVAQRLERSNRRTAEVNLSDIARHAEAGETILVPGKVLSNGNLTEKVDVVALKFSAKAQEKIESAGYGASLSEQLHVLRVADYRRAFFRMAETRSVGRRVFRGSAFYESCNMRRYTRHNVAVSYYLHDYDESL